MINETGVLGLVEAFDQTLAALQCRIRGVFPDFAWQHVHANTSAKTPESHMDRALLQQLEDANADDLNLLRYAQELLCVDQRND